MKRGVNNYIAGLFNQIITIGAGLILPRLFLLYYGSEANGLVSSLTQIFSYFSLLEAGVGAASLQALYGPVARGDKGAVSRIMSATSHYFKRSSLFYLAAVVGLAIAYPLLSDSQIPLLTVALLVLAQGLVGLMNYTVYAKYRTLLEAEGRVSVFTTLNALVLLFTNLTKALLIINGAGLVLVQSVYIVFTLVQILVIRLYVYRKHRWLNMRDEPDFDAIAQKNSVLVHQASGLVFNSTDTILLSIFCGFKVTSVYAMYSLVFTSIWAVVITAFNSVSFALGQSYNNERQNHGPMHECFEVYFFVLVFAVYSVAYVFVLPFVSLYTAGVGDIQYIDKNLPVLFLALYLLSAMRVPADSVIGYAAHYRQTRLRSVVEATINLVVSIVCVQFFGIYGVLFGTIAALLYRSNDIILYSSRHLLHRSPLRTYRRVLLNLAVCVPFMLLAPRVPLRLDSYLSLLLWAALYLALLGAVLFAVSSLFERRAFGYLKNAVLLLLSRKPAA